MKRSQHHSHMETPSLHLWLTGWVSILILNCNMRLIVHNYTVCAENVGLGKEIKLGFYFRWLPKGIGQGPEGEMGCWPTQDFPKRMEKKSHQNRPVGTGASAVKMRFQLFVPVSRPAHSPDQQMSACLQNLSQGC